MSTSKGTFPSWEPPVSACISNLLGWGLFQLPGPTREHTCVKGDQGAVGDIGTDPMSVTTIIFVEAAGRRRTTGLLRCTQTGSFPNRYAFKHPARAAGETSIGSTRDRRAATKHKKRCCEQIRTAPGPFRGVAVASVPSAIMSSRRRHQSHPRPGLEVFHHDPNIRSGGQDKQEVDAIGLFDDVVVQNPESLRTCPPSLPRLDRSRSAPVKDR